MALVTEDLCFRYPSGAEVLRSVSLGFEDPMTAIIGPNGAGKSTLLRLLGHLQVHRPSRGRVLMDGVELSTMRSVERVRRLAYVSQTPTVSSPLTVREVVGLSRTLLDRSDETVARAIAEVGLEDRSNDRFSELSVGQRQLAAIARAIAQFGGGDRGSTASHDGEGSSVHSGDSRPRLRSCGCRSGARAECRGSGGRRWTAGGDDHRGGSRLSVRLPVRKDRLGPDAEVWPLWSKAGGGWVRISGRAGTVGETERTVP